MDSSDVVEASRAAGDSPVVQWGARLGFGVVGLLHVIIGWLALTVAWGFGGANQADTSGALSELAANGLGRVLLWVGVAGFALLSLWSLTEAVIRRRDLGSLAKMLARFIGYAFYSWTCLKIVGLGAASSNSNAKVQSVSATVMQAPGGRLLVGLGGLAVIAAGGYHVHKGVSRGFMKDLQEHPGAGLVRAGQIGYTAKGIAIILVGGLLTVAAWKANPQESQGMDGALRSLRDAPMGPWLLTLIALGFVAYGVFAFGKARFARL